MKGKGGNLRIGGRAAKDIQISIANLKNEIKTIEEYSKLIDPLFDIFNEIREKMDIEGIPREGRFAKLPKSIFKDQHNKGINQLLGIKIIYV